ncbi:MAG: hypothetical protein RL077_365 [Verrucomicrobiota bacterium]|jgi:hypothetical protein
MKAKLKAVCDYLHRREPKMRDLSSEFLASVLDWYRHHGLLIAIVAPSGRVTAAAYGRRVADLAMARTEYAHTEGGPLLWVDWVGADSPRHLASLLDGVTRRWPDHPPVEIHGVKARHGDTPCVLNFQHLARKLGTL